MDDGIVHETGRRLGESAPREDRHHLLSDVRRLGGAWRRSSGIALARRGHESPLHHVPAAVSASGVHCRGSTSTKSTSGAIRSSSIRRTTSRSRCACTRSTLAHGLDLLHCHYAIPHATSAWIAQGDAASRSQRDIRVVTTLHGTDITIVGQDPSFRPITKFSIEKSDGLTAVSRYLQTETLTTFGCTACRIEVIPNFVDPDVYDRSRYTSILDRAGRRGQARADAHLELSAGETRDRRGADLRAQSSGRCRRC